MSRTSLKQELAALTAVTPGGVVTVDLASRVLGLPARAASVRLAALARAGWITRVRRGVYFVLPLEAPSVASTAPEDPWALANVLYAPCYIGGWTAAEHWGLTEQLFRSTFVVTTANIRVRDASHLGAVFRLVRVKRDRLTGLTAVWRRSGRVLASGPERTLIDGAVDPGWVGGVRHLAELLGAYRERPDADPHAVMRALTAQGNGAAAKRIGYLTEHVWPEAAGLVAGALAMRSAGAIKLDPHVVARGPLDTRWGLWTNVGVPETAHS